MRRSGGNSIQPILLSSPFGLIYLSQTSLRKSMDSDFNTATFIMFVGDAFEAKHNEVTSACVSAVQRWSRQENERSEQATVMSQ